jgi:hypothetical protein
MLIFTTQISEPVLQNCDLNIHEVHGGMLPQKEMNET